MARSFAALYHRIWADPSWRALDVDAQHLYLLLISQDNLNLAGVLPLQVRKWSKCAQGWDEKVVADALDRLRADHYVVLDDDTEEVLVRTFVRNSGAYKTPGMLTSILKFAESVQAPGLRRVLAVELGKLEPLEGKTAVKGSAAIEATRALLDPSGGPDRPGGEPIPEPIGDGIRDGIGDAFAGTHRGYLPQSTAEPIGDTSITSTGTGTGPLLSLVDPVVGGSLPAPTDEPPKCKRHDGMPRELVPDCGACLRVRRRWEADQEAVAALIAAEASKPKPMCPEHPGQVATHCGPCRSERLERGIA